MNKKSEELKKFSNKRAAQERRLRKIENELREEGQTHCFFYSHRRAWTFDHIVPKSANTSLIDCKENLVPVSSEAHYIITFGTNEQIKKLPNIKNYLQKMKDLDFSYWSRFMTNHELWNRTNEKDAQNTGTH